MGHILLPGQPNELNLQAIPGVSGEYGYYILDAPAYKKLYPESVVREDDNPVILIGKLF